MPRVTKRIERQRRERREQAGIEEELGLLARGDRCKVKGKRGTFIFMYTRNGEATVYGPVDPKNGKPGKRRSKTRTFENDRIKGQ